MPRQIPPQDYLRECLDYDPDTGALTWRTRPREHFFDEKAWKIWTARYPGTSTGTKLTSGHMDISLVYEGKKLKYRVHRVIWTWMTGEQPPNTLDHEDTDPAANRWENIRRATESENKCNRGAQANNKSGYKGVSWEKRRGKWRAQIKLHGKNRCIGRFDTAEEAFAAYCKAAKDLHGEFARTEHNRPRRTPREEARSSPSSTPEYTGF